VDVGESSYDSGIYPDTARTDLFVVRLDLNPSGTDTAKLFINPGSLEEPSAATVEVTGEFSFNELRINRLGYYGITSRWDEISIANNFAAAVVGDVR
jgi:hypothetical protein